MHLLDINVWLALVFDSHKHHGSAAAWFDGAATETCCFCRMSQMGFLRLATTPQVMMDRSLTLVEAWHTYDELCQDPRVVFAEEPAGIESWWRTLTQEKTFSPKIWNDAYLAAFAQTIDSQVITFDKVFAQYQNLRVTVLS